MKKICIVGASGKLGQYMVQHALNHEHEVIGVCREKSVSKLDRFKDRMTIMPGCPYPKPQLGNKQSLQPNFDFNKLIFICKTVNYFHGLAKEQAQHKKY